MSFFACFTQTYVTNVTLQSWARGLTKKTPNNILEAVLRVNRGLRIHGKNESEKCIFIYAMFVVAEAEHNIKFDGCSKPVNPYKILALTARHCITHRIFFRANSLQSTFFFNRFFTVLMIAI